MGMIPIIVKLCPTADAGASVSRFSTLKTKDTSSIRMWFGLKVCATNGSTATRVSVLRARAVQTTLKIARTLAPGTSDATVNTLKFTRPKTPTTTKPGGYFCTDDRSRLSFFFILFITIVSVGRVGTYWHIFVFDAY